MRKLSLAIVPLLFSACMSDGTQLRGTEGESVTRSASDSAAQILEAPRPLDTEAPPDNAATAQPAPAASAPAEGDAQALSLSETPAPAHEGAGAEQPLASLETAVASASVAAPAPPVKELPVSAECIPLNPGVQLPHFLPDQSALIVKFQKPCQTAEGVQGFLPKSRWTAVGVNCTGGLGRIDKKAHELSNPDLIIFRMELNCDMTPTEAVDAAGRKTIGIPPTNRLAFIPMTIEYWEFEGGPDAGIWTLPTLSKATGGTELWKKYTSQKLTSFPIRLYGRENAIGNDPSIFVAQAIIKPKGTSQFGIEVKSLKPLSAEEKVAALANCKTRIRAGAQCAELFGNP